MNKQELQELYDKPPTYWLTLPREDLKTVANQIFGTLTSPDLTAAEHQRRLDFWSRLNDCWLDRTFAEISLNLEGPEGDNVVSLR